MSFCLVDGAILSAAYDPEATQVLQPGAALRFERSTDRKVPDTIPASPFLTSPERRRDPSVSGTQENPQPAQNMGNLLFGVIITVVIVVIIVAIVKLT
jgi:hypothetical protein